MKKMNKQFISVGLTSLLFLTHVSWAVPTQCPSANAILSKLELLQPNTDVDAQPTYRQSAAEAGFDTNRVYYFMIQNKFGTDTTWRFVAMAEAEDQDAARKAIVDALSSVDPLIQETPVIWGGRYLCNQVVVNDDQACLFYAYAPQHPY